MLIIWNGGAFSLSKLLSGCQHEPMLPRSPWLTIWHAPRVTARELLAVRPQDQRVWLVYAASGLMFALALGLERQWSVSAWAWPLLLISGAAGGLMWGWLVPKLYAQVGVWQTGRGDEGGTRMLLSMCSTPVLLASTISLLSPRSDLISLLMLWWLIITVAAVSEIERGDIWRCIKNGFWTNLTIQGLFAVATAPYMIFKLLH